MNRFLMDDPDAPAGGAVAPPADGAAAPPAAGEATVGTVWRRPKPPCVNHPLVTTTDSCIGCLAPICATCTFTYPGSRRFCPACATAPRDRLTGWRRTWVLWSVAIGVFGTCTLLGLLVASALGGQHDASFQAALGALLSFFCVFPAMIGIATSVGAWEKGAANPAILWIGVFWNAVNIGIVVLLAIVGLFMNGG